MGPILVGFQLPFQRGVGWSLGQPLARRWEDCAPSSIREPGRRRRGEVPVLLGGRNPDGEALWLWMRARPQI